MFSKVWQNQWVCACLGVCTCLCVSEGGVKAGLWRGEVPPILGSGTHFLLLPSNFWLVCPSTWAWWGCFYYPASQQPPHPTLFCLFPKRLAFLGATSEAALEGRPAGSWVASCARAPRGGDNVLLIDWASWAEFRNLQKGETEKWGWGMSWEGWRGGTTGDDSQSTNGDSLTPVSDLFPFDLHYCQEGASCGDVEV